jgi:[CysO sulfur-carrier protein]-S-L-cysteine hydrolase
VTVRVPRRVLADIDTHARAAWPNECCGLLVGTHDEIVTSFRARNERNSPTSYRVAPQDHFAAIRHARALSLDVIGAYHSHPSSPPVPSTTDLLESVPGEFLYLIFGRDDTGIPTARAWRIAHGNFEPVPLVTV